MKNKPTFISYVNNGYSESKIFREQVENVMKEAPILYNRLSTNPSFKNFTDLEKKITNATEDWIREFFEIGGLFLLFESAENLNKNFSKSPIFNSVLMSKCLSCIQKLMNSEIGIETLITMCQEDKGCIDILTRGYQYLVYYFSIKMKIIKIFI